MKSSPARLALSTVATIGFVLILATPPASTQQRPHERAHHDRHFLQEMVPHHEVAIDMAELAPGRAEHKRIKRLAARIKTGQSREVKKMRSWYRRWYGTELREDPQHRRREERKYGGLDKLKEAKPFDKEFMRQMIPHHEWAIQMSRLALRHSDRKETRGLARSIIASQTRQIGLMRKWRREWYGD